MDRFTCSMLRRFGVAVAPMFLTLASAFARQERGPAQAQLQQTLSDVIERNSNSIVRVQAEYVVRIKETGEQFEWYSSGTGFILDHDGHVVTANHVVDYLQNFQGASKLLEAKHQMIAQQGFRLHKITVIQMVPNDKLVYDDSYGIDASISKVSLDDDFALLTCGENLTAHRKNVMVQINSWRSGQMDVPEFSTQSPRAGEAVSVTGFPGVKGLQLGIPGLTTNTGIIANPEFRQENGRYRYLADMKINHGDSGGPVYANKDGKIVGFMDAYLNTVDDANSGLAVIVPIGPVLNALKEIASK